VNTVETINTARELDKGKERGEQNCPIMSDYVTYLLCLVALLFSASAGLFEDGSAVGSYYARRLISNQGCLTTMLASDIDGNSKLNEDEYFGFVQKLTEMQVGGQLPPELMTKFNVLACLCQSSEGDACCIGQNRSIDISLAASSPKYLDSVCFLTAAGIRLSGFNVTLSENPTLSPTDNIMLRPMSQTPVTLAPTRAPATQTSTTLSPLTKYPTRAPTTTTPTSTHPVTDVATSAPTTLKPTILQPVSRLPTSAPMTVAPTKLPSVTGVPTNTPSTLNPTTIQPVSWDPTSSPTTKFPTTVHPVMSDPTSAPSTQAPFKHPFVSGVPSTIPSSQAPTNSQPLSILSSSPSMEPILKLTVAPMSSESSSPLIVLTANPATSSIPTLSVSILSANFLISILNGRSEEVSDESIREDLISAMTKLGKNLLGLDKKRHLRRLLEQQEVSARISGQLDANCPIGRPSTDLCQQVLAELQTRGLDPNIRRNLEGRFVTAIDDGSLMTALLQVNPSSRLLILTGETLLPAATQAPTELEPFSSSDDLGAGAIVGITFGTLVVFGAVLSIFVRRRGRVRGNDHDGKYVCRVAQGESGDLLLPMGDASHQGYEQQSQNVQGFDSYGRPDEGSAGSVYIHQGTQLEIRKQKRATTDFKGSAKYVAGSEIDYETNFNRAAATIGATGAAVGSGGTVATYRKPLHDENYYGSSDDESHSTRSAQESDATDSASENGNEIISHGHLEYEIGRASCRERV